MNKSGVRIVKERPRYRYHAPLYCYPAGRSRKKHTHLIARPATRKLALQALHLRKSRSPYTHLGGGHGAIYSIRKWREWQLELIEKVESL